MQVKIVHLITQFSLRFMTKKEEGQDKLGDKYSIKYICVFTIKVH